MVLGCGEISSLCSCRHQEHLILFTDIPTSTGGEYTTESSPELMLVSRHLERGKLNGEKCFAGSFCFSSKNISNRISK